MHTVRRTIVTLGIVAGFGNMSSPVPRPAARHPGQDVEALGAIVGVWQSDTVGGVSALSNCAWTPEHGGVVCEQIITGLAGGARHALNLYTFDATDGSPLTTTAPIDGASIGIAHAAAQGDQILYGFNRGGYRLRAMRVAHTA